MAHILLKLIERDDIWLAHHDLGKIAYIERLADDLLMKMAKLESCKFGWHHLEEHLWLLTGNAVELLQCILDDLVVVEGQSWHFIDRIPSQVVACEGAWRAAGDTHQTEIGDGHDTTDLLLDGVLEPEYVAWILSAGRRAIGLELTDKTRLAAGERADDVVGCFIKIFINMKESTWELQRGIVFGRSLAASCREQYLKLLSVVAEDDTVDGNMRIKI